MEFSRRLFIVSATRKRVGNVIRGSFFFFVYKFSLRPRKKTHISITYVGINDISTRSFSILRSFRLAIFLLEMLSKSSSKFEIRNDFHPVKNNFRRAYCTCYYIRIEENIFFLFSTILSSKISYTFRWKFSIQSMSFSMFDWHVRGRFPSMERIFEKIDELKMKREVEIAGN